MPFYYAQNLVEKQVFAGNPWDFQFTENITEQIRADKEARQEWYRNAATKHCFYTGFEGSNPNQRVSVEDNPPRLLHNLAADYDIVIPMDRVEEVVASMKIKPAYIETSLGRNVRLVWLLPFSLLMENTDFATFFLIEAKKWLCLDLLPGLDEKAFTNPTRLLCNGGQWKATGHGPISENVLQAFYVECARKFRFKSTASTVIPMDIVTKAIRERFPSMDWPGDFSIGAQGPSFWIPESTSPMSAIVKEEGMLSFSAHATKMFYPWADILGADFAKNYETNSIAEATKNKFWDEKCFWRQKMGIYVPCSKDEFLNHLETDCGIPAETPKGKVNLQKQVLSFIYNNNFVANAAPYLFRPPGMIVYQGKRRLNTYQNLVVKPSTELTAWGPQGKFPFHSAVLDGLFDPHDQLAIFLAWFQYFYRCGLTQNPQPGAMCFLMGGVNVGKTLTNREIVGGAMGGFADASEFIINQKEFNWHLFEVPLWCIDDDTISDSAQAHARVQAVLKKLVANKDFTCNQKFRNAGMTEWAGRIIATTNLDYASTRIAGPGDNGSLDKISMYRCAKKAKIVFPEREETVKILEAERPFFLRWLLEFVPPDYVIKDRRFGWASYQEPSLLEQAVQTGRSQPFKELLIEMLNTYFTEHPEATEWRGTVTHLQRCLASNAQNETVLRSMKLDQINRHLESVEKGHDVKCRVEPGPMGTRVWVFERFVLTPLKQAEIIHSTTTNAVDIFSK